MAKSNFAGVQVVTGARVVDLSAWTETWFAKYGVVCSLSVLSRYFGSTGDFLGVEVIASAEKSGELNGGEVSVRAADPSFNVRAKIVDIIADNFNKENLLLASLSLCPLQFFLHDDITFRISGTIPPGASMGTSASISTGFIRVVHELAGLSPNDFDVAKMAFRAETEVQREQSGTQDQWAAAHSQVQDQWSGAGANLITVYNYPETFLERIPLQPSTVKQLEARLVTVFVGQHNSSQTHLKVIAEQESKGPKSPELETLRKIAPMAVVALKKGNLQRYGELMKQNTRAQEALCVDLVGSKHRLVIKHANRHNCYGYKVNGAGGEGGSVTLLFGSRATAERFVVGLKADPKSTGFEYFEHQIA